MPDVSIRYRDVLLLALTGCSAIAGPALLGVAGATPDVPLAMVAIILTAIVVGVAPRYRAPQVVAARVSTGPLAAPAHPCR